MRALIRTTSLTGYLNLAKSLGLDGVRLMRDVKLDPADIVVPDRWVPAASVARLLDTSAREAGREDFGVRFAELRRLSTMGPLSVVLREEPDLRSVLALLMRYEYAYNEAMRMRLDESGGLATIRVWFEFGEPAPDGQALGLGVAALHGILRECAGPRWQPLSVCFQNRAPANLDTVHRVLGTGLKFDHDFSGIILDASDLDSLNGQPRRGTGGSVRPRHLTSRSHPNWCIGTACRRKSQHDSRRCAERVLPPPLGYAAAPVR